MARGRTISSAGQLFGEMQIGHGAGPTVGQPVMIRMQGVPTMPGYRDRPGKWNMAGDRVREWIDSLGRKPKKKGQPVMVRMQGVPTMPGHRDRPSKWNVVDPRKAREWLRRLVQRWRMRPTSSEV